MQRTALDEKRPPSLFSGRKFGEKIEEKFDRRFREI
jgi:hypothetical protein